MKMCWCRRSMEWTRGDLWLQLDGRSWGCDWDRGGAVIDGGDGWMVTEDSLANTAQGEVDGGGVGRRGECNVNMWFFFKFLIVLRETQEDWTDSQIPRSITLEPNLCLIVLHAYAKTAARSTRWQAEFRSSTYSKCACEVRKVGGSVFVKSWGGETKVCSVKETLKEKV